MLLNHYTTNKIRDQYCVAIVLDFQLFIVTVQTYILKKKKIIFYLDNQDEKLKKWFLISVIQNYCIVSPLLGPKISITQIYKDSDIIFILKILSWNVIIILQ